MKTLAVFSALLFSPFAAKADIISCHFTEPFFSLTYTTGTQLLSYEDAEGNKELTKKVGFLIRDAGQFELVKNGKVLVTLTLDHNGSDGMSDFVYPYGATVVDLKDRANNGVGGCESLALKKKTQE